MLHRFCRSAKGVADWQKASGQGAPDTAPVRSPPTAAAKGRCRPAVMMRPAAPGHRRDRGDGSIGTVLELAGIKNVLAKRLGRQNTSQQRPAPAIHALQVLRTHKETAKERAHLPRAESLLSPLMNTFHSKPSQHQVGLPPPQAWQGPASPPVRAPAAVSAMRGQEIPLVRPNPARLEGWARFAPLSPLAQAQHFTLVNRKPSPC